MKCSLKIKHFVKGLNTTPFMVESNNTTQSLKDKISCPNKGYK